MAGTSCGGHSGDGDRFSKLSQNFIHPLLDGLKRSAAVPEIDLGEDSISLVDDHHLRGNGSNIEA
jgi:hypothetical protein